MCNGSLKNELRLNWIADLRDPWTDLFYNKNLFQTAIAKKIDKNLEKKCLIKADKLIVVSEQISRQLIKIYPVIVSKINFIPNGFDPADFNNIDEPTSELKSISYIGSLSEIYPIQRFINAFKLLCKSSPEWQLKYVGNISESTKDLIKENQLERNTEFIPYTPHNEAIKIC